jgi:hypothetical protein
MTKYINNPSGKSSRHQAHELKYALSHKLDTLERWYAKITTPKPIKKKVCRKANTNNTGVTTEQLSRAKEVKDASAAYARWYRAEGRLIDYKLSTHWVARSLEEYNRMHPEFL